MGFFRIFGIFWDFWDFLGFLGFLGFFGIFRDLKQSVGDFFLVIYPSGVLILFGQGRIIVAREGKSHVSSFFLSLPKFYSQSMVLNLLHRIINVFRFTLC